MSPPGPFSVRPQERGAPDYELLWALILPAAALCGVAWLALGLPVPGCALREFTGIPCFGCGTTRCLHSLLAGDPVGALAWNPLAAATVALVAGFWAYCAAAVCLRLPRLRVDSISPQGWFVIRTGLVVVLAANWVYLLYRQLPS